MKAIPPTLVYAVEPCLVPVRSAVPMYFKVTARTIVQLGAELISSDSIAFYELIKNAFDAGSRTVFIDVHVRMDHGTYLSHVDAIRRAVDEGTTTLDYHRARILSDVDSAAPEVDQFIESIRRANSLSMLSRRLEEANYIQITDRGHGMSSKDLENVYLTVGTPHRRLQRSTQSRLTVPDVAAIPGSLRPILGEKGLGRLSAMRLGWRLDVSSTTEGELGWNRLHVDWRQFMDDNLMVEDIPVSLAKGAVKLDPRAAGTRLRICALASRWSPSKLRTIARDEFSKLTDPFTPNSRYPINLRYNRRAVPLKRFDDILFDFAHASAEAHYTIGEEGPRFVGTVKYRTYDRQRSFLLDTAALFSIAKPPSRNELESLGPFSVRFYWYNRRILSAIEGIGDQRAVRNLVDLWSGGLKVYRDGFRVNPYGSPDDDWLDIDKKALASAGYKVNRRQMIGVVAISSLDNPALLDQTNREGLRDCPEKELLVRLLQHLIVSEFRTFLSTVDEEVKPKIPSSFEDLEQRVEDEERRIQHNLRTLLERYPEVKKDRGLVRSLNAAIGKIRQLMDEASSLAESYGAGHSQLTNLAGIGLMLEIIAHELNRATSHTLRIIADADHRQVSKELGSLLRTLGAQMETIQKRLRILDPLSTAGRQRRETFDLVSWLKYILDAHTDQFARHGVHVRFQVLPDGVSPSMSVFMVKGMFVQILENLLSNSLYWLKIARRLDSAFSPEIHVTLDKGEKVLTLSDNGPGIPKERRDQVFQPFFTTKPPGEGHGLGLYISREIARYNGARLVLSDDEMPSSEKLNKFVLELGVK
ncbi:MAG: sensor histidine kinase [bacterium]|nr:sensor histidine kinase [bacterium]